MKLRVIVASTMLVGLLASCSATVAGTAQPERTGADQQFEMLLQECNTVTDDQLKELFDGTSLDRTFFGAICRWNVGTPSGIVDVTFNWFENGSIATERTTDERLGYSVKDVSVQGRKGLQAQPPNDPDSCGVTVGSSTSGIIGWWVQYEPASAHPDPCVAANKLAELSLSLTR